MIEINNSEVKILIVDDVAENLEISGKILEKENYDIYTADSGLTALELIEHVQFDLILLDIMMPVMDGFETCKQIRSRTGEMNIPIIFLTAKTDIDSIVKGFEYGVVDYIRKPFNALELIARVRNHIELKKIREQLVMENKKLADAYEQLKVMATTDTLTKLYNRREIMNRMEYEKIKFERNKIPFTVIIADIDFFKKVNDNYGHACGDLILQRTGEIFKSSVRNQDSIARWGGEEFLLLLPDTTVRDGAFLAEKLRVRIEEENFSYNNKDINITITFGVSAYVEDKTLDDLIRMADIALYNGKESGRNCVMINESILEELN